MLVCNFFLSVLIVEPGPSDALPPIEYRTPIDGRAAPPAVDCRDLNVDMVDLIVRRFLASEAKNSINSLSNETYQYIPAGTTVKCPIKRLQLTCSGLQHRFSVHSLIVCFVSVLAEMKRLNSDFERKYQVTENQLFASINYPKSKDMNHLV